MALKFSVMHNRPALDLPCLDRQRLPTSVIHKELVVVLVLPKRETSNATHHIEHILQPILELHRESLRRHLFIHAGNTTRYPGRKSQEFREQNSLRITEHLRYSPDLAL
jgi:hypothetical protein